MNETMYGIIILTSFSLMIFCTVAGLVSGIRRKKQYRKKLLEEMR